MFKKISRKAYRGFSFIGLFLIAAVLATACSGQPPANQTMTVAAEETQGLPVTGATQPASTSGSQTNTPQPNITSEAGGTPPAATSGPSTPQATPVPAMSGGSINTVDVTEGNYYIKLSHNVVQPGQVTFNVTNQGPDDHEFLIFQTKLAQDNLPTQNGQIQENGPGVNKVEDHSQVTKGTSYTVSVNLQPGHYVVVCNLPGHYLQGMHAEMVVSQNAGATLTAEAGSASAATPTPKGAGNMPTATPTSITTQSQPTTSSSSDQSSSSSGNAAPTVEGTPASYSGSIDTVNVVEGNYHINLGHHVVAPGKVTFNVTNNGPDDHEFVIFKTKLSQDNLPTQNGQINENAPSLNKVFDHPQVSKGTTYTATVNLDPGHYVVVCNLPGHYLQGMHAELIVAQNAAATLTAQASSGGQQQSSSSSSSQATATPTPAPVSSTVGVIMRQNQIFLDHTSVASGMTQFNVQNQGIGQDSLMIVKSDMDPGNLPVQNAMVNTNASGVQKIASFDKIQPGKSTQIQAQLQPGSYVLVSNDEGKYSQGEWIAFTVTSGGQSTAASGEPTATPTPTSSGPTATPTMTATAAATSAATAGVPATGGTAAPTQAATSGTPEVTPTVSANAAQVKVIEEDYSIFMNDVVIPAGQVQFQLRNLANMQHEFVVFKTDLASPNLPVQNGQVVETSPQLNKMGEQDQYPGGESRTLTLTLQPGHYVAICNIVGHYQQGMHIDFWVTGSQSALPSIPSTGGQAQQATQQPTQQATPQATPQATQAATQAATPAATAATPEVTPTVSANAAQVKVIEEDYSIFMNDVVIPAGQVQFQLRNLANMQHEFVVFKTDLASPNLPVQNGQVVETSPQLNKMGEQDQYPGGESRTLTLTLQPGHYVAICNIVGHYQQGMHIDFWVTSGGALPGISSASSSPSGGG